MPHYGDHGTTTHRRTVRAHRAARRKARSKSHTHKHGYHLKHPRKKGSRKPRKKK
jgi:hypothetical protein